MAQPDNVARMIAAGSALFTAINMSVSYATYRRKKPKLKCRHKLSTSLSSPSTNMVAVHLRNQGETPITITQLHLQIIQSRPRWALLRDPVGAFRYRHHPLFLKYTAFVPLAREPIDLGPFADLDVRLPVNGCARFLMDAAKAARILPTVGGRLRPYGKWEPIPDQCKACQCADCTKSDAQGTQLTFEDML